MKFTELHRHIDCSIRPSTLVEFGLFASVEEVRQRFWVTEPCANLKTVLDRFGIFQKALSTKERCERVAFEVVEDARGENITQLELRYSPRFASGVSGLPWEDVFQSFLKGLQRGAETFGVKSGLICILSRGYEEKLADETIDFAIRHKEHCIGVDLAGYEEGYPCRLYTGPFKRARDAGLKVTVHAGESCGPENIWEAIDLLGAVRIGHGCTAIHDKELMRRMARDRILIETCPTSNFITRAVPSWEEHPLPRFLEAGIPCSVSTDDPGFFGVTLQDEFERCREKIGLSKAALAQCNTFAIRHSFLG